MVAGYTHTVDDFVTHPVTTPVGRRPTWRRELAAVTALVALAALLRLTLAARGWPVLNSDEATMGLMGGDVLRLGARPVFFYGQDYMGALQAYLEAPVFALFGPTPLAVRLVTTIEFVAFLLIVYALARALWSPTVGLVTLALLALGPEWALLHEMQAGVGAQDTLLFGALVVWLAYLRLGAPHGQRRALALDVAFGLAAGVGLWSDFLFLPFLAAALLALLALGLRDWRVGALRAARALGEVALGTLGFVVGAAPFLLANISSHGLTLREVVKLTQTHTGGGNGVSLGERLAQQLGAAGLVGLPQALGSVTVCPTCVAWPGPGVVITPTALAYELVFAAPFTLLASGLWLWSALPLARAARRFIAQAFTQRFTATTLPPLDPQWWGRLMLTLGGALTLLQYVVSRTSYTFPASSARYLIGLYICAPVMVAPLVVASHTVWRRARAHASRGATGHTRLSALAALLAMALLASLVAIDGAGAAHALAATSARSTYGQPMGQRDARLVAFLKARHSTDFYAGYWTCLRLMFLSRQQVSCAVINQYDAFAPGFNRYAPAQRRVAADPHPAWVFDLLRQDEAPTVPAQVAACVRSGQSRCQGYTSAKVDDYLIFYYAGASTP